MNMDIDTIFLGQFSKKTLDCCFSNGGRYQVRFWETVKHLAFGMDRCRDLFEGLNDHFEDEPDLGPAMEELKQFYALESFKSVLDGMRKNYRREPRVNGAITFGDPGKVCRSSYEGTEWHENWISYLCELWISEASGWDVPKKLDIKSISRGGRLQKPA